jgi:LacI family transcriptional regulator
LVSIKAVADKAQVSIATVSRVVNENYYVAPETKDKVLAAIKELNYYPNSLARSLKNDITHTIGFIVSDISNNYFTTMVKSIEDVANSQGYNIIVCSTDNKKDRELSYLKMLLSKKIDGIIINTTGENNDFIAEISKDLPVVLIDRKITYRGFKGDFITNDNVIGAYSLTSHLLSLGHRKIAVVNGIMNLSSGYERYEGFIKAMNEYDITVSNDYIYRYDGIFTIESGYKAAQNFMEMEEKPTAIIAMNNMTAIGILKYMHSNDIAIPDVVSMAAFGEIDNSEILYVKPTVTALNPIMIGLKSIDLLLSRIKDHNNIGYREVLFMPQLFVNNSTKRLN